MFRTIQSVIVAIAAAAVFTPSGYAEAGMTQSSIRVPYADLNLSTAAGARTLVTRLKSASKQVCGKRPAPLQLKAVGRYQTCVEDAISRAVAEIDSPVVTAYLTGRTGTMSASR